MICIEWLLIVVVGMFEKNLMKLELYWLDICFVFCVGSVGFVEGWVDVVVIGGGFIGLLVVFVFV